MPRRPAPIKLDAEFWLGDEALRSCSIAARGLFADMVVLMWTSRRTGFLLGTNGERLRPGTLAQALSLPPREVSRLTQELIRTGALKQNESGTYYLPWMVRAAHICKVRAEAGQKGGRSRICSSKAVCSSKNLLKQKRICSSKTPPPPPTPLPTPTQSPSGDCMRTLPGMEEFLEEKKSKKESRITKKRKIDPIWDTLVECFFEPKTKQWKTRFGRVSRDLKLMEATPEGIRETYQYCVERFRNEDGKGFKLECILEWYQTATNPEARPKRAARVEAPAGKYARFRAPTPIAAARRKPNEGASDAEAGTTKSRQD